MRNQIYVHVKWMAILPLIVLCGCTSTAFRHDYTNYSKTYGDSNNEQLLLNLARLSQDDPVYFIQLGSISSQYQFNTAAGFMPSYTKTDPANIGTAASGLVQRALTLGGSVNAGLTATPVFQFLPLTGSNFVQAILSPISAKVYLTFYDQGYPADLVARTMISSIQWAHITNIITPTNITPTVTTNYQFLVNDPHDPTYPDFLEFCAELRDAQICHMLTVDQVSSDATTNVVYGENKPKLADIVSAIQASFSVNSDTNGKTIVSQTQQTPRLVARNSLVFSNYLQYVNVLDSQTNNQFTLNDTAPAQVKITNAINVVNGILTTNITLKARTFEAAMFCVAKQEAYFEQMEDKKPCPSSNIIYSADDYGPLATVTRFRTEIQTNNLGGNQTNTLKSTFKVRPTMMITYDRYKTRPHFSLAEVGYRDGKYLIGDEKLGESEGNPNQTVFTMLSYLFAQTAISTQNLPVQQLIQVQ
jgi:hypothetical protein